MNKDTIWAASVAEDPGEREEVPTPPLGQDCEHRTMRCRHCHVPRVFNRRRLRHALHFICSIGTIGFWLPVWGILILLQTLKPWACSVCGKHQRD